MEHHPVLVDRVVELLAPALEGGGVVVDATLGRGGHAARVLAAFPGAILVGIDRDPDALDASRANLEPFADRVRLARDDFANLAAVLERLGIASVRGVLLDLGVSSPQLDRAERGFSFRSDGPLDMRMDPSQSLSADEVVNDYPVDRLASVIARYGEERWARRIARGIDAARPLHTTTELADTVKASIPAAARRTGGHPARKTFQAIRIEVNEEMKALEEVLPAAADALEGGGRIVALSYHSLEDRAVKRFFAERSRGCVCPPDLPVCRCGAKPTLKVLTRRPEQAGDAERTANPRSTAAKLRAAERILADIADLPAREVVPA